MKDQQAILVGGFCEMFELCARCGIEIVGVVDATPAAVSGYDLPYLGTDEFVLGRARQYTHIPLVVTPDAPTARRRIVDRYRAAGFRFASVVSPEADISPTSKLQEGVVIQSHVVITAQTRIGSFARLNVGVKVLHECWVGDFVTCAPGVTLLGRVKVGDGAYVGASSTVLPGRVIGRGSSVEVGTVVMHDVADRHMDAGVPAKRTRRV